MLSAHLRVAALAWYDSRHCINYTSIECACMQCDNFYIVQCAAPHVAPSHPTMSAFRAQSRKNSVRYSAASHSISAVWHASGDASQCWRGISHYHPKNQLNANIVPKNPMQLFEKCINYRRISGKTGVLIKWSGPRWKVTSFRHVKYIPFNCSRLKYANILSVWIGRWRGWQSPDRRSCAFNLLV